MKQNGVEVSGCKRFSPQIKRLNTNFAAVAAAGSFFSLFHSIDPALNHRSDRVRQISRRKGHKQITKEGPPKKAHQRRPTNKQIPGRIEYANCRNHRYKKQAKIAAGENPRAHLLHPPRLRSQVFAKLSSSSSSSSSLLLLLLSLLLTQIRIKIAAVLELISCILLVYCMAAVPVELSFWKVCTVR